MSQNIWIEGLDEEIWDAFRNQQEAFEKLNANIDKLTEAIATLSDKLINNDITKSVYVVGEWFNLVDKPHCSVYGTLNDKKEVVNIEAYVEYEAPNEWKWGLSNYCVGGYSTSIDLAKETALRKLKEKTSNG
jgi:hypothetical protein